MNTDLFGNPADPSVGISADTTKRKRGKKGEQCRDCKFMFVHLYRNDWAYCDKRPDPRTSCKRKKIGKTDEKCRMFEPIKKEE